MKSNERLSKAGYERAASVFCHATDLWLATVLVVAAVYFFSGYFTTVRFDRERIEVAIRRGRIQVTGLYHYTNDSRLPAVLTLRVPFPVDSKHSLPKESLLCVANEDGRPLAEIAPTVRGRDVRFRLVFRPREAKWVRLDYVQEVATTNGTYLLTTTRAWRRSIGHGDYLLRLPQNFRLSSSNYLLVATPGEGSWKQYAFSRTDFYPDRDWNFVWEELHPAEPPSSKEGTDAKRRPRSLAVALVPGDGPDARLRQ